MLFAPVSCQCLDMSLSSLIVAMQSVKWLTTINLQQTQMTFMKASHYHINYYFITLFLILK